jgi:hypothetical protein
MWRISIFLGILCLNVVDGRCIWASPSALLPSDLLQGESYGLDDSGTFEEAITMDTTRSNRAFQYVIVSADPPDHFALGPIDITAPVIARFRRPATSDGNERNSGGVANKRNDGKTSGYSPPDRLQKDVYP